MNRASDTDDPTAKKIVSIPYKRRRASSFAAPGATQSCSCILLLDEAAPDDFWMQSGHEHRHAPERNAGMNKAITQIGEHCLRARRRARTINEPVDNGFCVARGDSDLRCRRPAGSLGVRTLTQFPDGLRQILHPVRRPIRSLRVAARRRTPAIATAQRLLGFWILRKAVLFCLRESCRSPIVPTAF